MTLTNEQFRQARAEIIANLKRMAENSEQEAVRWLVQSCQNSSNPSTFDEAQAAMHKARGFRQSFNFIAGLEREGYDWNRGYEK